MLAKARSQKLQSQKEKAQYQKVSNLRTTLDRKGGKLVDVEILRDPEDILVDPKYGGQTEILLKYVPLHCIDGKTTLDVKTLKEWIICAIVEEDPVSQKFFDDIQKLNDLIEDIEKNIRKIPKIAFLDDDGNPKPEEDAKKEREKLFVKYGEELMEAESKLDSNNRRLKEHIEWRRNMGIDLTQVLTDPTTSTSIWKMEMSGADDIEEIEDSLLSKRNWSGIKLAKGDSSATPPIPPWAGRGDIPDASNPTQNDYTEYQVNMLGVRILRVPTGLGYYRQLDRQSSAIHGDSFELYYGEYSHGYKHGYGIQINDSGVYAGDFEHGFRHGTGRWDLADGTTVIGQFDVPTSTAAPISSEYRNPYLEGEPHGSNLEVFFSDGGYYKGDMYGGEFHGQGDYQSAFNEMMTGSFHNGLLHGKNSCQQTVSEDMYLGNFQFGELHGYGTYLGKNGDSYDGYWDRFLRHGRGISRIHARTNDGDGDEEVGCYRGYHINGCKHGKGSLEYGQPQPQEQSQEEEELQPPKQPPPPQHHLSFTKFMNMYQGYFLGNQVTNQGNILQIPTQKPLLFTRSNPRDVAPIKQVMHEEIRSNHYSEQTIDKYMDMEQYIRKEIFLKKRKIYQQQKHYTKKMIYQDDVEGYFDSNELQGKLKLRNERLMKMKLKPEKHIQTFQKALIPRLQKLNSHSFDVYTKGFNRTKSQLANLKESELIDQNLIKIAFSDFEEVRERQRFLKYDLIWERAEEAYRNTQKSSIHG